VKWKEGATEGREMYLVLLISQKDYEHIKKVEASMMTQKTGG